MVSAVLRAGFSVCLLAALILSVDSSSILKGFGKVNVITAVLCFAFIALGIWVSAYKWQGFLLVHGISVGCIKLIKLYLIGIFFNNFLPTSIGGDVVRATLLCRGNEPRTEVVASIFAERATGLAIVLFFAITGVFLLPFFLSEAGFLIWSAVAIVMAGSLFLWCAQRQSLLHFIPAKIAESLRRFKFCLDAYLREPRVLVRSLWTSILFQLLSAGVYFLIAQDMGLDLTFVTILAITSLVTIVTLLPISLNGLGLREGGMVLLLGHFNIDQSAALALSLAVYVLVLVFSLLGWGAFSLWKYENSPATEGNTSL